MRWSIRAASMERMDDREIIRRAQAGDRHAFGALFDLYYPCVYRYLNERLGGAPDAEDLCQEVFLNVLGTIDEYPAGGVVAFDEWLLRVARRLATEHHRDRTRWRRRAPTGAAAPQSAVAGTQRLNPEALALLPEQQQQVVAYRYQNGLSVRQTATALGLDALMVQRVQRAAIEIWLRYAPTAGDCADG